MSREILEYVSVEYYKEVENKITKNFESVSNAIKREKLSECKKEYVQSIVDICNMLQWGMFNCNFKPGISFSKVDMYASVLFSYRQKEILKIIPQFVDVRNKWAHSNYISIDELYERVSIYSYLLLFLYTRIDAIIPTNYKTERIIVDMVESY